MISIKTGERYTASKVRSGDSGKGFWEMIVVEGSSKNQRQLIFPINAPSGVTEGNDFIVEKIDVVKNGYKKDKEGKWEPSVTIEATVKPVVSEFGDENPFEDDVPPWELPL